MATIREAFAYAAKNPTSDFARNLSQLAASGSLDLEAKANGIDLTPFKPVKQAPAEEKPKTSTLEKVSSFTGGQELSKGVAQTIAFKGSSKSVDQSLKSANDVLTHSLELKKKAQKEGRDTTRLDKAIQMQSEVIKELGGGAEDVLNPNKLTDKQVIGDALQLATTAAGGKVAGSIAGKATKGVGLVRGAVQGAKVGAASGAVLGGVTGASQGLQQDLDARGIANKALGGAIGGGITGGLVGGVTGAVSGKIKANKIKKEGFAEDLVMPKATEKVKIQALQERRVSEQGLLSGGKILPSKRDKEIADSVRDVVSHKKSEIQNLDAISKKVSEINSGVKAYVKSKKVPFNTNQLRSQLNSGKADLKLIFASDANAEKTYNAAVKEFLNHVKSKDTAGLFEARQSFDKIPAIKKLLDSQGLGENTKREVVLTLRGQANKYVASLLPKGNQFRDTLLKESRMIEAIGNIAEKSTGVIDQNKIQALTKKYPVLKGVIGTIGAYLGLKAIGVGGSIVGSSD